jgi:TolA-binding protein
VSRALSALLVALVFARAPYQCARTPDDTLRREDTAAQALYGLAQKFHKEGDDRAYKETLAFLIERYPASREAHAARVDLGGDGARDAGP